LVFCLVVSVGDIGIPPREESYEISPDELIPQKSL
jgi:hypothetical protein